MITMERVAVTTTGSAGSASGTGTSRPLNGLLLGIYLDYHASAPATTDVTVSTDTTAHGGTIATVSDNNSDGYYPVRVQAVDNTGAAISGVYEMWPLVGKVKISVAQADALTDCVVAWLYYLEE